MRIQPSEIEIPTDDPFRHDQLVRKKPVEILTNLVDNIDGPCVLAVDAAWGEGKTTFIKMWAKYLDGEGFPVVEFNAWETDFSDDPFAALSSDLTKGLGKYTDNGIKEAISEVRAIAEQLAIWTIPGAVRLVTAGIMEISSSEVSERVCGEYGLNAYEKAQQEVRNFRNSLQIMAQELSDKTNHPLIVVIDELDRCRPTYAVELLEIAKHLFSVDHIVFVLAINRSQLEHSVEALYGDGFDAKGYLRRFFDIDFRLPKPQRRQFIDTLLREMKIYHYFQRDSDRTFAPDLLKTFFNASSLSLREIEQSIHRLGLVLSSLKENQPPVAFAGVVALILRTIDTELYHRFYAGDASAEEVVETIGKTFSPEKTTEEFNAWCCFEAAMITIENKIGVNNTAVSSSLFHRYKDLEMQQESPGQPRAEKILSIVADWQDGFSRYLRAGFDESVQRIELLSPNLDGLGENGKPGP